MNIVITGSSRGIGFELMKKFISVPNKQYTVYSLSRNIKEQSQLSKLHENLCPIKCDITNLAELENALGLIKQKCKTIDIIINNAGLLLNKPFLEINSQEIDDVFNTNFKSPFFIIKQLFSELNNSEIAHIVNISSMGGFQGAQKFSGLSVYSSSKAALACLSECLAAEFKATPIKINTLCIGAVQTEMLTEAFPDYVAPVSASQMAEFIFNFALNNYKLMNGMIIPVALSTP
ncbi:MAG TPA: SDR family oxidoreductase [Bacteroidia bacterium]|nr:SDR family oxidoreductase [Bacteroidia bacterium]